MKKTLYWHDPSVTDIVKAALEKNSVSITSTDTILGLLAPLTQQAFDALNALKGARDKKPYLVIIGSLENLDKFVDRSAVAPRAQAMLEQCWPGPLTVIFKAKKDLPSFMVSADGTIAIRCPQHKGLLNILKYFDGLFSTSANRSGRPTPRSIGDLDQQLASQIELGIVDQEQQVVHAPPSTIIDVTDPKRAVVVREGAYPVEMLKKFF